MPAARKAVVRHLRTVRQLSERRACGLVCVSRMTMRYVSRRDDSAIRARLRELAVLRRRWGYRKLRVLLLREGMVVNHKRVERIYREEGLSARKRRRVSRQRLVQREAPGTWGKTHGLKVPPSALGALFRFSEDAGLRAHSDESDVSLRARARPYFVANSDPFRTAT